AAVRHHRLSDHLAAEHPLPSRLWAVAAEQIHLDRFQVEDRDQVNQAFGHGGAFGFSAVIPGRYAVSNPESRDSPMCNSTSEVHAVACPGMTDHPCFKTLFHPANIR